MTPRSSSPWTPTHGIQARNPSWNEGVEGEEELPSEFPVFTEHQSLAPRSISRSCELTRSDTQSCSRQICTTPEIDSAPSELSPSKQVEPLLRNPPVSEPLELDGSSDSVERAISQWRDTLEPPVPVRLHVYDLSSLTRMLSLPVFHLGVEVYQREHSFTSRGVVSTRPGDNKAYRHKEVVMMGNTDLTGRQVYNLLAKIRRSWAGNSYDLLSRNCVTFSVAFCRLLGIKRPIPAEFARFAAVSCASCTTGIREPTLWSECTTPMPYGKATCMRVHQSDDVVKMSEAQNLEDTDAADLYSSYGTDFSIQYKNGPGNVKTERRVQKV